MVNWRMVWLLARVLRPVVRREMILTACARVQRRGVGALSGGWKMKLALSRAILQQADILLLDEPTNHLDVANVKWLMDYLMAMTSISSMIVSHDSNFLETVCTHIIHYENRKLKCYRGNLTEFVKQVHTLPSCCALHSVERLCAARFILLLLLSARHGSSASTCSLLHAHRSVSCARACCRSMCHFAAAAPAAATCNKYQKELSTLQVPEAASYYSLEASTILWKFPEPGYLEGVKTKDKAILKMTQMDFAYPGVDTNVLTDVNVQARSQRLCESCVKAA